MTRSALPPLAIVLMLVAACPTLAAAQTLLVQVDNDARIPAADIAQMEEVVARSFLAIGVHVLWEHGEVALDDPRGVRVHLRLLSRTSSRPRRARPFEMDSSGDLIRPLSSDLRTPLKSSRDWRRERDSCPLATSRK